MSDAEWDAERNPHVLLDYIFPMRGLDSTEEQSRASRLYLLGCARLAWERLPWACRKLVELAEKVVDRESIDREVRRGARELAEELTHGCGDPDEFAEIERRLATLNYPFGQKTTPDPALDAETWSSLAHLVYLPYSGRTPNYRRILQTDLPIELLRDVFPNPFRDSRILADWQNRDVTGIARGMYDNRNFEPMPLLADALQDAGCENEHILAHCRASGPHIRGCWVLEGILTKRKVK